MAQQVYFLLGIHNHQPVGNFDSVFKTATVKSYYPFLETLEKFPEIKCTVHFSGCLIDWLVKNEPGLLKLLRKLIARKQIEMMTGGYYEPILSVIPDHDKLAQITKLTSFLKDELGADATGLWLAERVWEPHLPKILHQAGIKYTLLDDAHFKSAGLLEESLDGYYITEEDGHPLALFPISQKLRYAIPFKEPVEALGVLRGLARDNGDSAAVFADDGEKFGLWPDTYEWVYEKKWLERFFESLRNEGYWVKTCTFSEYLKTQKPRGRIYLPTASYAEMMEWALPPDVFANFERIKEILNRSQAPAYDGFLKGGFWRNFFVKYEEVNHLHKKMLWVSHKIQEAKGSAGAKENPLLAEAENELLKGQCNCPYWHGIFGGLYLNYLRFGLYQHLVKAEALWQQAVEGKKKFSRAELIDFNLDGYDEVLLRTSTMNFYIAPSSGGSLFEWDYKPKAVNLTSTVSRRKESYHSKLIEFSKKGSQEQSHAGGAANIHDSVRVKEQGLENFLFYDWYSRRSLVDHFFGEGTSLDQFKACQYVEEGDFVNQPYQVKVQNDVKKGAVVELEREGAIWRNGKKFPCLIKKEVNAPADSDSMTVKYSLKNLSDAPMNLIFGVEFDWALLAGHADDRSFYVPGRRISQPFLDVTAEEEMLQVAGVRDGWLGIEVSLNLSKPANLWRFPIETVSQSESGFERVYQSTVLLPHWKFLLDPGKVWQVEITKRLQNI